MDRCIVVRIYFTWNGQKCTTGQFHFMRLQIVDQQKSAIKVVLDKVSHVVFAGKHCSFAKKNTKKDNTAIFKHEEICQCKWDLTTTIENDRLILLWYFLNKKGIVTWLHRCGKCSYIADRFSAALIHLQNPVDARCIYLFASKKQFNSTICPKRDHILSSPKMLKHPAHRTCGTFYGIITFASIIHSGKASRLFSYQLGKGKKNRSTSNAVP